MSKCSHDPATNTKRISFDEVESFDYRPRATVTLSNPQPMMKYLTRTAMEVLPHCRDNKQFSSWVTGDVYRNLIQCDHNSLRARSVKNQDIILKNLGLCRTMISNPADGVVDSVMIVNGKSRSRSIANRLKA